MNIEERKVWVAFGVLLARLEERAWGQSVMTWMKSKSDYYGSFKWVSSTLQYPQKTMRDVIKRRPERLRKYLKAFRNSLEVEASTEEIHSDETEDSNS
jgi:hypothetical protein